MAWRPWSRPRLFFWESECRELHPGVQAVHRRDGDILPLCLTDERIVPAWTPAPCLLFQRETSARARAIGILSLIRSERRGLMH